MAVITSTQDGGWATGATWVGGVAPAAADSVVLGHAVSVSDDRTCIGITINSGGVLTLNPFNSFLQVNGNIVPHAGANRLQIDMLVGSVLSFGNGGHTFGCPSQYPGSVPFLQVRGGVASPCTIQTVTGGTRARFLPTGNYTGLIDAEWCNFLRIGISDGSPFVTTSLNSDGSIANSSLFRMVNCTLDGCAPVVIGAMGAHARYTIQDTTTINEVGTHSFQLTGNFPKNVAATRLFDGVRTGARVRFYNPKTFQVQNCVLGGGFETTSPADGDVGMTMENNLIILTANGDPLLAGPLFKNNFCFYANAAHPNKHFFEVGNYVLVPEYNIEDCIFEAAGSDSDGDTFILGTPAAGDDINVNITGCIYLPNGSGNTSGTIISQLGNIRTSITVENNTAFVGTNGGLAVGETYIGFAGLVKSYRGNLLYDTSARGYKMFDSGVNDSVPDLVTAANANYNGGFNLLAGSNLKGYHNLEFSAGAPGANDVAGDPNFVDASRDFLSYDIDQGGDGVQAAAILRWLSPTFGRTAAALNTWIREGFAPRNQDFADSSFNGGDIGAVPVAEAGGGSRTILFSAGPLGSVIY